MKLRFLQVERSEKKKKLNLFQLANIKKIKKRNLAIVLIILLVLAISAGSRISDEIFRDKDFTGGNTEAAQAEHKDQDKEKDTVTDVTLTADLENRLATDFIRTLKSGRYVIKYKTTTIYEGQSYEVETTYAVSGGNVALIAGDRATVVRDNKVYMMNHTDGTIISWDVNHEKGSPERIDTEALAYVESRWEGGLACEEYSAAASRLKLYFNNNELVKMAARVNKEDIVMDIISVDKTVPDSLFEVPSGYRITNI